MLIDFSATENVFNIRPFSPEPKRVPSISFRWHTNQHTDFSFDHCGSNEISLNHTHTHTILMFRIQSNENGLLMFIFEGNRKRVPYIFSSGHYAKKLFQYNLSVSIYFIFLSLHLLSLIMADGDNVPIPLESNTAENFNWYFPIFYVWHVACQSLSRQLLFL